MPLIKHDLCEQHTIAIAIYFSYDFLNISFLRSTKRVTFVVYILTLNKITLCWYKSNKFSGKRESEINLCAICVCARHTNCAFIKADFT